MKFCNKCGTKLLFPNARFCHKCGTPLPRKEPPYLSPIAETYYETIFKPMAEERLGGEIRRRETPTKPFEK